jgi:beta-lactam-binding protein with PASTA domain
MKIAFPLELGSVLNERYRITRLLGSGATTASYEADDLSLQRPVVVKILLPEVLANDAWRDYFRHEITAVAALHHPNLTSIYDWGTVGDMTYVVMEYLPGGSLRDVMASRNKLTREQSALIGLEVASVLAYAHARGFIHGGLRPSKILFDDEGRVRVSDLGVAATLSRVPNAGRDLDHALYCSPEQVLGAVIDGRSDVYSLALILFYSLTGEVAHGGVSIESVRSNRLGAPLPHREELGPLDLVLAMGAAPAVDARPDAAMFASRLGAVAATLAVPRPVTLSPGNLGGFKVPSPTDILTAPAVAVTGQVQLSDSASLIRPLDVPRYREALEPPGTRIRTPEPPRTNRALGVLVAIVILALLLAGAVAWKLGAFASSHPVPSLLGLSERGALSALSHDGYGFSITVTGYQHSPVALSGTIVRQNPAPGQALNQGGTVKVELSSGPSKLKVPRVRGLSCAEATTALVDAGLKASCPTARTYFSSKVATGKVIAEFLGTERNPRLASAGATIEMSVSKGPAPSTTTSTSTTTTTSTSTTTTTTNPAHPPRAVPNLVGRNPAQVKAAMTSAELYYATVGPGSQNGTWTTVVSQSPIAGTKVPWHSLVTVHVK